MQLMLMLLAGALVWAQEIKIQPLWKQGDVVKLEYTRVRQDARRPESNGSSKTPIFIEVLEAGSEGYVLRWKNGQTTFPAGRSVPEAVLKLEDQMLAMHLEIVLNARGEFQSVRNEKDVVAQMTAMTKSLVADLGLPEKDAATLRQVMSPEMLLASATNDAKTYFGLYGVELKAGEGVTVEIEEPFPLSAGRTLPARLKMEMGELTEATARLQSETVFDPAGLRAAVEELLLKAGLKPEQLAQAPAMTIEDRGSYIYDRKSGWLKEVIADRTTKMPGAMERRDRREFRQP